MRKLIACLILVALALAGCSSSGGGPTHASTSDAAVSVASVEPVASVPAPSSADDCSLPDTGDVIYWVKTPGQQAVAQLLGSRNLGTCKYSYDQAGLDAETSQQPGFCTIVVRASANPRYNIDATPAPRPAAGLLAQSGPAC